MSILILSLRKNGHFGIPQVNDDKEIICLDYIFLSID